jgi:hypothetical protein
MIQANYFNYYNDSETARSEMDGLPGEKASRANGLIL